jgi:exopolysaccharide biosynthesis polyprenyl glycosylphosphotransferase
VIRVKSRFSGPDEAPPRFLYEPRSAAPHLETEANVPYPLLLQWRARVAVRRHAIRGFVRGGILVLADLGVMYLLKFFLRALRDGGHLGPAIQSALAITLPRGRTYPLEFAAAVIAGLFLAGAYGAGDRRKNHTVLAFGATLGIALIFWGRFWATASVQGATASFVAYSALSFVVAWSVVSGALIAEREVLDRLVLWLRPRLSAARLGLTRVIAAGTAANSRAALQRLHADSSLVPLGFVDTNGGADPTALGDVADIVPIIRKHRVDAVILAGDVDPDVTAEIIGVADAAGCQVFALPPSLASNGLEPRVVWLQGVPVVRLTRPGLRGGQLLVKRVFDIGASALAMLILSPLYFLLAIAVRMSSPGPIIFPQIRVGLGGHIFRMKKFRSMVVGAEERRAELADRNLYVDTRLFKVKDDPRVTRFGAFLRRWSLDELPQFWNVLRGEMSLVGPRPPLPSELSLYQEHQYVRFDMKPGVTGPWQVSGRNNITDFEEVIRLETEYMRNWSIWKDVGILLRTLPAVLKGRGAL